MAAGSMSWQYYNNQQKYGSSFGAGNNMAGGDMQEMHLKMSKKIAQLTKVIYALNTKNDEHEAAMTALKDAHEEEMQQMLTETAAKLQQYRLKIGNELDLRRKIQNLEECISSYEKEKKCAAIEMDGYKQNITERETNLQHEYEQSVNTLTRELLEAKSAFEQRIQDFEMSISNLERERNKTLDSVTIDLKSQLQNMKAQMNAQKTEFASERQQLLDGHDVEIQKLKAECANAKIEIKKCIEDCDAKMDKAKSFYEHELLAMQAASLSDEELETKIKEREAALKEEYTRLELALRSKVKGLTNELAVQEDTVQNLQDKLRQSEAQANSTTDHVKDLRDQLGKLNSDYTAVTDQVAFLEKEVAASKSRLDSQSKDLLHKSSIIGTLEAIKLTQEESISDLEAQLKELKRRFQDLDAERISLQNSQSEENTQLVQQLKALNKRIETMAEEKIALQRQFKRDLDKMKLSHDEEVDQVKIQFEKEAESMEKNHQAQVDVMKVETKEAMDKLLYEMQERLANEKTQFEEDKAACTARLEGEKFEIAKELKNAQKEIARLTETIGKHENGLGDASSRINDLKSRISDLENEVRDSDARRRTVEASADALRSELKQQIDAHNRKVAEMEKVRLEDLERMRRSQMEEWEEKMRSKLSELQSRLTSQYSDDRHSALIELESQKNDEINALKAGWEDQIRNLASQMSDARQGFEAERRDIEHRLEESRTAMSDLERKLRAEAQQAAADYALKVEHLTESHEMAVAALEQRKDEEARNNESKILSQHREETHSQLRAHQISLEALKDKLKREKMEEWERREQEFQQDMEEVKSELQHHHASTLDDVTRQYEHQLSASKSELEQARQASRRNEEDLNRKLSDLEMELRTSTSQLNTLRDRVTEQNESLSAVNRELDSKGQEVLRMRSEANAELRRREEEITRKFQGQQDRYEAESIRQKQAMVNEFNRATDALKDKLSALHIALREAEEMYERRESRPEDLDMINQLKELVRERESQIHKLVDDKKYYQMELVNRETNFNKVFSAAPNVGVLNPRGKKKGQSNSVSAPPRFASQFVSVPNLNSIESAMTGPNRLEPIRSGSSSPGSYNGTGKHLQPTPPPHPKKFLRTTDDDDMEDYFSQIFELIEDEPLRSNGHNQALKSFSCAHESEQAGHTMRTTTFEPSGKISHQDTLKHLDDDDAESIWQRRDISARHSFRHRSYREREGDLTSASQTARPTTKYGSLPKYYRTLDIQHKVKHKTVRDSFMKLIRSKKKS